MYAFQRQAKLELPAPQLLAALREAEECAKKGNTSTSLSSTRKVRQEGYYTGLVIMNE